MNFISGEHYSGVDNLELLLDAKNYNAFLQRMVIESGKGAKVALDFGAGIGTFATAMRKDGTSVYCLETDPALVRRLTSCGHKVYSSLTEIPKNSLDYVYSLNVLEHLRDDLSVLRELNEKLKPEGRIFLYVPAFEMLYTSMDRKVGHFRRYRKEGLTACLLEAGFEVDLVKYVDSLGFLVTLVFKLIGNSRGDINPRMLRFYDRVLFPLSLRIDRVVNSAFGKNLMITARRRFEK